jgi:hypothetical protein
MAQARSDYRTVSQIKHCLWTTKMVTHSKIVDPLYILHENMQYLLFKKKFWQILTFNFLNILENTYLKYCLYVTACWTKMLARSLDHLILMVHFRVLVTYRASKCFIMNVFNQKQCFEFLPAAINEVDGLRHWNDNSPPSPPLLSPPLPSPSLPSPPLPPTICNF